jgi:cyanate permease
MTFYLACAFLWLLPLILAVALWFPLEPKQKRKRRKNDNTNLRRTLAAFLFAWLLTLSAVMIVWYMVIAWAFRDMGI